VVRATNPHGRILGFLVLVASNKAFENIYSSAQIYYYKMNCVE
jgi:hypothetical protein